MTEPWTKYDETGHARELLYMDAPEETPFVTAQKLMPTADQFRKIYDYLSRPDTTIPPREGWALKALTTEEIVVERDDIEVRIRPEPSRQGPADT